MLVDIEEIDAREVGEEELESIPEDLSPSYTIGNLNPVGTGKNLTSVACKG